MASYFESGTYPWALTGVFAAVHFVVTLLPFSISVSGTGVISFGMISSVIVGFLLGPVYGTVSVLVGSFLGMFVDPALMVIGLATPIATASGALSVGFIRVKKPVYAIAVYFLALIIYLVGPIGLLVPEVLWFHIIVILLALVFIIPFTKKKLFNEIGFSSKTSTRAIFLIALVGVCVDQAVGSAIGSYYLVYALGLDINLVAGWWTAITFIYPVERFIGALIATVILAALTESISGGYFSLPGMPAEEGSGQEPWGND
jgi:hypothetical protein